MKSKKDIYGVPDGYFDSLEMRLSYIPGKVEAGQLRDSAARELTPAGRSIWRPATLLTALAGIAIVLSITLFFRPARQYKDGLALVESFYASDLIPHTNPYLLYDDSALSDEEGLEDAPELSDEDVANYLIDDGVTVDMIDQIIN